MAQSILVLGIGNVLFADEGIGVHMLHYLQQKYQISGPHNVTFVDGGTLAHALIPLIAGHDQLLVIDTVNSSHGQIGDVYLFDFDQVPHHIDFQGSVHEVEMLQTLNMMDMVGDRPPTHILGVIPAVLEAMSFQLSAPILAAVPLLEQAFVGFLQQQGLTLIQVSTPEIQAIADQSCQRAPEHETAI